MEDLPHAEEVPQPASQPHDPEVIESIRRKVASFPEDWQQVWEMHLEGVNHDEIARRMAKSRRTIQYWLAEMLELLSSCVPAEENERSAAKPGGPRRHDGKMLHLGAAPPSLQEGT